MCKSKAESGVRCTHDNEFGRLMRNMQAKKQYHANKGDEAKAEEISKQMDTLKARKQDLEASVAHITPYTIPVSEAAEKTLDALTEAGFRPYIVGGTVRDALTKQPIKDVDIEVYDAEHDEVLKVLKKVGKVDEVGKQFGVIKVVVNGEDFDVSLPRKDNKTGSGHKDFTVEVDKDLSIEEATTRRDFTVNALMYDHSMGYILDAHTGIQDYENRTLRHVSEAFDEDPLRVLRGVQMAARFDMELHPDTVKKSATLANQFNELAKERVQIEFEKLFTKSYHPDKGFSVLKDTTWDKNFPGLEEANTPEMREELQRAGKIAKERKLTEDERVKLFGAVVASHITPKKQHSFLSYITVGDKLKSETHNLANAAPVTEKATDAQVRHWVHGMKRGVNVEQWANLEEARNPGGAHKAVLAHARKLKISRTPETDIITGDTLLALTDRKPGPWMRLALEDARAAQYEDKFTDKSSSEAWLNSNKDRLFSL